MRLLFTGGGTSGSWQVRGIQLGQACHATVKARAALQDIKQHDAIVAVKRLPAELGAALKAAGKPWVWDVVDFFPQPVSGNWSKDYAIGWVQKQIKAMKPNGVIWPNQQMRNDCDTGLHGIVLYHHHLPNLKPEPLREHIRTMGYIGSPKYMGKWTDHLAKDCAKRGWNLSVNSLAISDLDIAVAFRDGVHNGYVQSHWKSNVKLANAHGAGIPFIGQRECGYLETGTGHECFVDHPRQLAKALDYIGSLSIREHIRDHFLNSRITIDDCAKQLRAFVETL